MEKVICVKCRYTGYTASPEVVNCPVCGGRNERFVAVKRPASAAKEPGRAISLFELTYNRIV